MSKDMHVSSGEDYYENMMKNSKIKKETEKEKYFYENGVKYKLVFDSEIRTWVREIVSENKKEK